MVFDVVYFSECARNNSETEITAESEFQFERNINDKWREVAYADEVLKTIE